MQRTYETVVYDEHGKVKQRTIEFQRAEIPTNIGELKRQLKLKATKRIVYENLKRKLI